MLIVNQGWLVRSAHDYICLLYTSKGDTGPKGDPGTVTSCVPFYYDLILKSKTECHAKSACNLPFSTIAKYKGLKSMVNCKCLWTPVRNHCLTVNPKSCQFPKMDMFPPTTSMDDECVWRYDLKNPIPATYKMIMTTNLRAILATNGLERVQPDLPMSAKIGVDISISDNSTTPQLISTESVIDAIITDDIDNVPATPPLKLLQTASHQQTVNNTSTAILCLEEGPVLTTNIRIKFLKFDNVKVTNKKLITVCIQSNKITLCLQQIDPMCFASEPVLD